MRSQYASSSIPEDSGFEVGQMGLHVRSIGWGGVLGCGSSHSRMTALALLLGGSLLIITDSVDKESEGVGHELEAVGRDICAEGRQWRIETKTWSFVSAIARSRSVSN